jgi:galactokinase
LRFLSKHDFFGVGRPIVSASAPGRLDVMGGIADYSGSLVLEMPIRERTTVWAAARKDGLWRAFSREAAKSGLAAVVQARTTDLKTPAKARKFLSQTPRTRWAAYVLGCVPFLLSEKKMPPGGADLYLESEVPLSKGLSSSASAEVAAMAALGKLFNLRFVKTELPTLCQKAENLVAGAPCGLMDQLTSYLGKRDRLLPILCQPDRVMEPVAIPRGIHLAGVDSGVLHWVGGSSYSEVRAAAFMGYSLIALQSGAKPKDLLRARKTGDASGLPFSGYLARLKPDVFSARFEGALPEKMKGRDFLGLAVSIDLVTEVKPGTTYRILAATRHPIEENARVNRFKDLLASLARIKGAGKKREVLAEMGELMFRSHASYGACGLGEPVTDALVEEARKAGPERGVYGAKITGGGSGGTACFLLEGNKGLSTLRRIVALTLKGPKPFLSLGSSDGGRWTKSF